MPTRDWSIVTKIAPELSGIVKSIERFLETVHDHHIEPGRLIRQFKLGPAEVENLHLALEIARDRKLVKRSFGVLAPGTRCHALGYWDKLARIPKVLYDTRLERFRRSDGEFIIVYRHPDAEDGAPEYE